MKLNYGLTLLIIFAAAVILIAVALFFLNRKTPMPGAAGLQITDITVGTGAEAANGDEITVNYVGTLTTGVKFDSSYDHVQPFSFRLGAGQVIVGWDEGLVGMKVGGKRKLVIPPELGYGETGQGPIPPNATLIFEVELLSVGGK